MWSMRILFLLSLTFSFGSFLSEEIIEDEDEDEDEGIHFLSLSVSGDAHHLMSFTSGRT